MLKDKDIAAMLVAMITTQAVKNDTDSLTKALAIHRWLEEIKAGQRTTAIVSVDDGKAA